MGELKGEAQKESGEPSYRPLFWLLLGVVLVWIVMGVVAHFKLFGRDPGEFGDMFGAVNALFSGLAFATLIFTIHLQRGELKLQRKELQFQREELRQNRDELRGQKEQMKAQNDLMAIQGFESSFFHVLGAFSAIVSAIEVNGSQGHDAFGVFVDKLTTAYKLSIRELPMEDPIVTKRVFDDFYERFQGDCGHYFRTLYNLVKLVDKSPVEDKHFYTNIIRAQLSNQETLILFYNCAVGHGLEKFKPLVERYALLKNMPRDRLLDKSHIKHFEKSAFGKEFTGP